MEVKLESKYFPCPHCGDMVEVKPGFAGRRSFVCHGCFHTVRRPKPEKE